MADPLEQRILFARAVLSEYEHILRQMELCGGWLDFGGPLSTNLIALKVHWWDAYLDEKRARLCQALTFFSVEELKEVATSADAAADAQRCLDDFCAEYQGGFMDGLRAVSDEEWLQLKRDTEAWLDQATEQEAAEYWSESSFEKVDTRWLGTLRLKLHWRLVAQ